MDEKTTKDIILIIKGWYNKDKYASIQEAISAYYTKYYKDEVEKFLLLDKDFILKCLLEPIAFQAIKKEPNLCHYIFNALSLEDGRETPYNEIMYDRLIFLIQMINHGTFDFSEYAEMFFRKGVVI